MAEKTTVQQPEGNEKVIAKAKDFWTKYNRPLMIASVVIILGGAGWYIYKNYFKNPKEQKAQDQLFRAEDYWRKDSVTLALNGDGLNPGFLKIISQYGGTDAANLAKFYAGSCYLKLNQNDKAVKYLKQFSTSSKPLQARAYKLLGDASADLGKNNDALDYYKKAAHHDEEDEAASSDALFMAAYFADRIMKNSNEAKSLYRELLQKYPRSSHSRDADTYLAQLGEFYNGE
jgi:predicted negative regulator of RcsB-dependent stress response